MTTSGMSAIAGALAHSSAPYGVIGTMMGCLEGFSCVDMTGHGHFYLKGPTEVARSLHRRIDEAAPALVIHMDPQDALRRGCPVAPQPSWSLEQDGRVLPRPTAKRPGGRIPCQINRAWAFVREIQASWPLSRGYHLHPYLCIRRRSARAEGAQRS